MTRLLPLLALLAACGPPDHIVARWDLYSTDGALVQPHSDRYTFWQYGGVDHRVGTVTAHGTITLEDDATGELLIDYADGARYRGVWLAIDCPPPLPHPFGCRRIEAAGNVELRAPGF